MNISKKKPASSTEKSGYDAIFEAQKIAFAPFVFQTAKALRDTGLLDLLYKARHSGISVEHLAEKSQTPEYGVKVLLDFAKDFDLVSSKESLFYITKVGYFILKDKMTQVNMNFVHDVCYEGFFNLTDAIKNGTPEGLKVFGKWDTIYEALSQLPPNVQKSWFDFDHYYSDEAFPQALPLVFEMNPKKILDIGGNTGKWALQCVNHSNEVEVTIVDLPGQLEKAIQNIHKKGFSNRIHGHPLNLLEISAKLPTGFDIIWMSQFLDCFSEVEIAHILQRTSEAIGTKGRVCILETFCDRQPNDVATYCINATSLYFTCMANGNSRMYHAADMIKLVENAGLIVEESHDYVGQYHTLLICKKKD